MPAALSIVVTTAGRAALVNAKNDGTAPVLMTQVGFSPTAIVATEATAALPGETKRLAAIAGRVVADDKIHVTVKDESSDAYDVRSFALYLADGTLFAAYGQATPIFSKTARSTPVLAIDLTFVDVDATDLTFGDVSFDNPPASLTVKGVVELATQDEAAALADQERALTAWAIAPIVAALLAAIAGRAPLAHTHLLADVVGLVDALAGKAPTVHTHAIGSVNGLQTALNGKSNTGHGHALADVAGLIDALAGKTDAGHVHQMESVHGLITALGGKAPTVHGHTMDAITGLVAALAGKAATGHRHALSDIDGLTGVSSFGPDSGYAQIPGSSLIVQWGRYDGGSATPNFSFPIAFPSACVHVGPSGWGLGATNNAQTPMHHVRKNSVTRFGFGMQLVKDGYDFSTTDPAGVFTWFAIGY